MTTPWLENATCRNCGKGIHRVADAAHARAWFHDESGEHPCEPTTVAEPGGKSTSPASEATP